MSRMTISEKQNYLNRIEMIDRNLRMCNSGNEAHEVGNMRNSAELVKVLLTQTGTTVDRVKPILDRLERRQVAFFKKKFSYVM